MLSFSFPMKNVEGDGGDFMFRRAGCLFIAVLLSVISYAFAADINATWYWEPEEGYYRYSLSDGDSWTLIGNASSVTTCNINNDAKFCLQYSEDGEAWQNAGHSSLSSTAPFVDISWTPVSDAQFVRYMINDSEWIESNGNEKLVLRNIESGKPLKFALQFSDDGTNWSETEEKTIIPYSVSVDTNVRKSNPFSIRATFSPLTFGFFDFFNGHGTASSKALTISKYGLSADLEIGWYVIDNLRLYIGGSYAFTDKKETVIPDANRVHFAEAYLGLDVKIVRFSDFSLNAGLFSGALFSFNAGYMDISSILGARIGLDYAITDNFIIGIQTGVTASYLDNEDSLYKSMTYLLDTVALTFETRF